jgi:hypothetical protein
MVRVWLTAPAAIPQVVNDVHVLDEWRERALWSDGTDDASSGPSDADSPVSTDNAGAETEAYEGQVDGLGAWLQRPLLAKLRMANNQRGHHVQ